MSAPLHPDAGEPPPPQRGLTREMRDEAQKTGDAERMQMWAGQSAKLGRTDPAETVCQELWEEASRLLLSGKSTGKSAT